MLTTSLDPLQQFEDFPLRFFKRRSSGLVQRKDQKVKQNMSNDIRSTRVTSSQQEPERERRIFTFKATQAVWLLFGILEVLIALRIGLLMIGANPNSPIVALIYGVTYLFLFPFNGLIGSPTVGNMVFEISSVFAMIIYALIAWAVERVVWLIFYRPRGQVVGTSQTTTNEQHLNP
jgi:hypothetical protein